MPVRISLSDARQLGDNDKGQPDEAAQVSVELKEAQAPQTVESPDNGTAAESGIRLSVKLDGKGDETSSQEAEPIPAKPKDCKEHSLHALQQMDPRLFPRWIKHLSSTFGFQFVVVLTLIQHGIKGFANGAGGGGLVGAPTNFLYAQIGDIDAAKITVWTAVTTTPWGMKSFLGMVSDLFPIRGYNKKPYILGCTVIAVCCYIALGVGFQQGKGITGQGVTLLLFVMNLHCALLDLLSEAKYAEKLQEHPKEGPDLMSYVWGGIFFWQLISTVIAGEMIAHVGGQFCYLVALVPVIATCYPIWKNWLQEPEPVRGGKKCLGDPPCCSINMNLFKEQRDLFALSTIVFLVALILTIVGTVDDPPIESETQLIIALVGAAVVIVALYFFTLPVIFKAQLFFFIQSCLTISISGASFYFFTDDAETYPDGPHFDQEFYTIAIGVVSAAFSIVGIMLYNRWMHKWKYRTVFTITNLLFMAVNLLNCVVYSRQNVKAGIPDQTFVLGEQAFQQIVSMWTYIPSIVMISQLCPKGMEATMYAILAGCSNLGGTIAAFIGSYILKSLEINPSGPGNDDSRQFDKLWIAAIYAAIGPCIPLIILPWLIPDARQTDRLLDESTTKRDNVGACLRCCRLEKHVEINGVDQDKNRSGQN